MKKTESPSTGEDVEHPGLSDADSVSFGANYSGKLCLAVSTTPWSSTCYLRSQKFQICSPKDVCEDVHCSTIHDMQELNTFHMLISNSTVTRWNIIL